MNNPQSSSSLISQTLQLPSQLPLFKYNINFSGVKKLLEDANIQINFNSQEIIKIKQWLKNKVENQMFKEHQKIMNQTLKFGLNIEKFIQKKDKKFLNISIPQNKNNKSDNLNNTTQFANKMNKLSEVIDYLLMKSQQHQTRIQNNNHNHTNLISSQFSRLQSKLSSSLQSFTKTINTYFTQSNKKTSSLQTSFNIIKSSTQQKIQQFQLQLNNKISQNFLINKLQSQKQSILQQFQSKLQSEQMSRLAFIQEYKNQLKQVKKDVEMENKLMKQKLTEMDNKVKQSLSIKLFDMEKHKIYQKLSQFKNKNQQFTRKNNQFYDFRKNYLTEKQKIKQDIIGIEDQLKKLNDKQSSFKKIQNVTDLLNKFDPHLMCEIINQVKLHEKQIGKLQRTIMLLQANNKNNENNGSGHNSKSLPINTGENSQMIQKIIKQYMNNMSFQTRVKKVQKDIIQVSRRADIFNDLEKKIYTLSKELDTSALKKQIKKKCDEQSTKKQFKILQGKIQNLFDYFKHIRKQLDLVYKRTAFGTQKHAQTPSLTSKKLLSANCISCTTTVNHNNNNHTHIQKQRTYSRKKMDYSFDQGYDYLKSATYGKLK